MRDFNTCPDCGYAVDTPGLCPSCLRLHARRTAESLSDRSSTLTLREFVLYTVLLATGLAVVALLWPAT